MRGAAVMLVAAAVLGPTPADAGQSPDRGAWQERQRATLTRLVEQFTGAVAAPCGIGWLPAPAERRALFALPESEIAAGLTCVLKARTEGRADWALWQLQGIDSAVFGGVATTPRGEVQVLHYDDFGGRDELDLTPCVNPRLGSGPGVGIGCDNRMVALSATELDRALAKLDEDVAATVGPRFRGIAARAAAAALAEPRSDSANLAAHPGFLTSVVDAVQREIEAVSGTTWPACPRHARHALEFRDHRWFCVLDGAFFGDLGSLAAVVRPAARR